MAPPNPNADAADTNSNAASATSLESRSYRITVDDGRDSFFALSIEDTAKEEAWLMSDTVVALESMR